MMNRNGDVMLTRRGFAGVGLAALAGRMMPEPAYAQRALIHGNLPPDMVWLNANENPEGPPRSSIEAMTKVLPESGRYHYQEFGDFYAAVARSEDLAPEQILVGAGSSEVLHAAVEAFTAPARALITVSPTYEGPVELAARGLGREVIQVRLEPALRARRAKARGARGKGGRRPHLPLQSEQSDVDGDAEEGPGLDGGQPAARDRSRHR